MKKHISARWMLVVACLLLAGCIEASSLQSPRSSVDESKEQLTDISESSPKSDASKQAVSRGISESQSENAESVASNGATFAGTDTARDVEDPLSVTIDLDAQTDLREIDLDEPFRIVLTNTSDQPIRIWNLDTKNGYYQLSFHFTNSRNGKTHVAKRTQIDDEEYWESYEGGIEPGTETIELAPRGEYMFSDTFAANQGGHRVWGGLPDPNSADRFAVSAQFESWTKSPNTARPVWIGRIQSENVTVNFLASRLKTPHDYLGHGFPGKSLELMKADPNWIARQDDYSRTPLHIAATLGRTEVVKWLLDNGADVNAIAYNGRTPLHLASDRDVIGLIIEKKPDFSIQCRGQGQTPLQRAAANLAEARDARTKRKWQAITELYLDAGAEYDILTAIHLDDIDRVKTVLRQSPELADNFQRQSPLRTAVSLRRLEICRYLIEQHRVDVNDFERGLGYPIIKEELAHPHIVRLLIENGADLKTRITWRGGRTGIWIIGDDATALHFAARDGVPETVRLLIDNGVDIFATAHDSAEEKYKQTALEVAAYFGKADNANAILNHPKFDQANDQLRKNLLNKCLLIGAFPSWLAREAERPKLIETLLKKGADPNASEDGVTAMQIAARQIHPGQKNENQEIKKVIAVLAKHGATVDLFSAVAIGDEVQVARLLERSPKSANSRGPDGYPTLHFAVGMNYESIVRELLGAGGNVEIRNKSNNQGSEDETALHCAAFWGRYEIAKVLIGAGADVNALDEGKRTPLHDATRRANMKIIRLLLENGANVDARDADGTTPLEWSHGSREVQEVFREHRRANEK
ncbi:MAG: ankyrin repeat domain-containing protein [Pirellulaceae bacterium]|nr:ankyrin repeat domain-containing protein [Pirellulaceae bacterium]